MSGAQVANGFIFSAELKARNVSDEEFLDIMYNAFFNRLPDPDGYSGWLASMRSGMSRQQVLAGFINSIEFKDLCTRYGIHAGNLKVSGVKNDTPPVEPNILPASAPSKPASSPPPAPTVKKIAASPAPSVSLSEYDAKVLELLNEVRAQNGLGALKTDEKLGNIAQSRSADMIERNYFSHTTPDGENVFDMLKENDILYTIAGENLAQSKPANAGTPEAFVNAWMESPGHRANILRASFTKIGIGLVDGDNRRVLTNVFTN